MIYAIVIIVSLGLIIYHYFSSGLQFEEDCALYIQDIHFKFTESYISIGQARAILRGFVEVLDTRNSLSEQPKFISLRNARIAATEMHILSVSMPDVRLILIVDLALSIVNHDKGRHIKTHLRNEI